MAIPTATEIREFLEGYEISITILTDAWIEARRDGFVIPTVERIVKGSVEGEDTKTEYLSGNGKSIIFLSSRNVTELISMEYVVSGDYDATLSLSSVRLIPEEGVIRVLTNITEGGYNVVFRKGERNIKVVYKTGGVEILPDIKEAIIYLCSEQILGFVAARTGGGPLSVQGFSRNFGERGKYQDIRNDLKRQAMMILNKYKTGIVGSV